MSRNVTREVSNVEGQAVMFDLEQEPLKGRIRVIQIIAGTLLAGVLAFLVIVIVVVERRGEGLARGPGAPAVSVVALILAGSTLPLGVFLPRRMTSQHLKRIANGTWRPLGPMGQNPDAWRSDEAKLLQVYSSVFITEQAMLEGLAFLGGIAYLLEAEVMGLVVAAVPFAFMLAGFPTRGRIARWLTTQLQVLDDERRSLGTVTEARG